MPIKPENAHRYPPDWPQIVERIKRRAGNRCEQCGVANHALGGRLRDGTFLRAEAKEERMLGLAWPSAGEHWWCSGEGRREWLRIIRIVLTVAHLNHEPEDCRDENLRALCQRCHLRHDAPHHAQTAYQTRRAGKAARDLFQEPST